MADTVAQLSSDTKIAISLKKLQGKAHTKTENELYNEGLPSGITMDSSTVFGETPPTSPNTSLGDITNNTVEKVRLTCTFIAGSDTPDGKHGFKLSLPSDYETTSTNPKRGTGSFLNDAEIVNSNGQLQLVPPSFDYRYEAVPYYGTLASLTSIPLADPRDWNLDYFNGVLFQQDPPANSDEDPSYIDAYLYIGKYLTTVVSEAGGTTTFTSLTDTPNDLTGHAGKVVKVNSAENGLEFGTITSPSNFVGDDGDNSVNNEAAGLVPAPVHGDAAAGKYLKADGTWSTPPDTDTTYVSSDFDHDQLTNYEANEHIDWTQPGVGTIDSSNYTNTTYTSSDFDHNQLTNYVANEHIDWTQSGVGTIDPSNYTNTTYSNFVGDDGDSAVNNEAAGLVPAPAHGDAALGKFLRADGYWAVPAGGGGGGGGGASATGVNKYTVRVATQTNALTAVQFTGLNTTDVPADASLSVYLNGELLLEGDVTTVTAFSNQDPRLPSTTNTHYYISSINELTFGFALVPGDYLVVEKLSFETTAAVTQVSAINGLKQDTNVGNITIEPNYDGEIESIIKKAYDGTGITVDPDADYLLLHDNSDQQVKYIKASQVGSGQAGVIGDAEDPEGYSDGLFTDFNPNTPTGWAIDRFNEILKIVVPDPCPNLFYTNCRELTENAGNLLDSSTRFDSERRFKSAVLSFGESNTGAPKYADSTNASSMNPIDTNGVYEPTTQGQNIRLGTYLRGTILPVYYKWNGTWFDPPPSEPPAFPADLRGPLNDSVTADTYENGIVNYRDKTFGNANIGNLKIHLNGTLIHTSPGLDSLDGRGDPHQLDSTDDPLNRTNWDGANWSDSGFWKISTKQSAKSDGGLLFPIFQNRYAEWLVHENDMRKGWNWMKIEHSTPSGDYVTNTIEWMVISDEPDIAATVAGTFSNIVGSNIFYLSGVKYFSDMSYDWSTVVVNAYDGVYSTTPIDFNVDYGSFTVATDQNGVDLLNEMPTVGVSEDYTKSIDISSSAAFSYSSAGFPEAGLINGSIDASLRVYHPNVGPIVGTSHIFTNSQLDRLEWSVRGYEDVGTSTLSGLLVWDPTSSNSETVEDFKSETYRQQPGNYDTQADVWAGGNWVTPWDSQELLDGASGGHNTGLLQASPGELRAPTNTTGVTNGDFATVTNGPSSNADYSSIVTGTRTYYRAFKNTGLPQRDIRFTFDGDASIISNATAFTSSTNEIKMYVKIPGKTGWMDTSLPYSLGNNNDNDGAWVKAENNGISTQTHKYVSFGLTTIDQDEYVILRIEADATWTGNLSAIEAKFNASSGTQTTVPDTCQTINCTNPDGIQANLSFGTSLPIPASDPNHPYENVAGANGLQTRDVNGQYGAYSNRKGIYGSLSQKVGIVNSGEGGDPGSFAQYAILYGNEGTIELQVNDTTVHSVDLSSFTGTGAPGSGSATSLETTHNSSGFTNISTSTYTTWSDGIPDFRYFVRTMQYQIGPEHQRPGHNWVRVVHTGAPGGPYETNYIEWVVDPDTSTFDITSELMENWTDTDIVTQSGIKYFQSPSSSIKFRAVGAYSNVYTNRSEAIGWRSLSRVSVENWEIRGNGINNVTGLTQLLVEMPDIATSIDSLDVTGSISWAGSSKVMPGSLGTNSGQTASASARVYHPLKTSGSNNYVDAATMSKTGFLINSGFSDSSNATSENFSGENYRILSNTDFSLAGNISQGVWDDTIDLSGITNGYSDGLCQYNGNLVAPANAGSNGNFLNVDDGGTLQGPSGNVNYSGLSGANERVYIRPFYNATGQSKSRFDITISGVGILTSETQSDNNAGALDENNFKMFVKIVEPGAAPPTTGWLDCGEHSNSSITDNSGCRYGALNNALPVNIATTSSFEIIMPAGRDLNAAGSNLLLIKVVANDDWTGRITSLGISL